MQLHLFVPSSFRMPLHSAAYPWSLVGRGIQSIQLCLIDYAGFTSSGVDVYELLIQPATVLTVGDDVDLHYVDEEGTEFESFITLGAIHTANLRSVEFVAYRRDVIEDPQPTFLFLLRVKREWTNITFFHLVRILLRQSCNCSLGRVNTPSVREPSPPSTILSPPSSPSSIAASQFATSTPPDDHRDVSSTSQHNRTSSEPVTIRIMVTETTTIVSFHDEDSSSSGPSHAVTASVC
ncbi:hypothetical protein C8Q76DRAFT_798825 [Earliella scabrosa]|nr:hypothetical protein C8Q76DRAFT_798825 [Earliella scabrosa]